MYGCSGTKEIDVISRRNYTFYVSFLLALAFILHPDHGQREECLKHGRISNKLGLPDSPQLGRRVINTSNLLWTAKHTFSAHANLFFLNLLLSCLFWLHFLPLTFNLNVQCPSQDIAILLPKYMAMPTAFALSNWSIVLHRPDITIKSFTIFLLCVVLHRLFSLFTLHIWHLTFYQAQCISSIQNCWQHKVLANSVVLGDAVALTFTATVTSNSINRRQCLLCHTKISHGIRPIMYQQCSNLAHRKFSDIFRYLQPYSINDGYD